MSGLLVPIWGTFAFLILKVDLRSRDVESSFSMCNTFLRLIGVSLNTLEGST